MKIDTKDFGELEIKEEENIHFLNGIFAFEEVSEFALIEMDGYKQKWLQSVKAKDPRFIVFDSEDVVEGYEPTIPSDVLARLKLEPRQKPCLFVIAVIPENIKNMTVNLKSPIVVNLQKRLAAQVILDRENYPVRYHVFQENEGE